MMHLPTHEIVVFLTAMVFYGVAAVLATWQLRVPKEAVTRLVVGLVSMSVCLDCVVLIFRAVSIKAIPLTGLFESMLVLTIVLALLYVLMSIGLTQVWFSAVMTWSIFTLALLAALVAEPAAVPTKMAITPWTVFHAISMLLSSGALVFSTATASLYLLSDRMLKQKRVMSILGRVPNVAWLRLANKRSLLTCLVGMTLGLVSGIGLAIVASASMDMGWADWSKDPKIVLIAFSWLLLIVISSWHTWGGLTDKALAYATIVMLFFVIFAVVGVTFFCGTRHVFT